MATHLSIVPEPYPAASSATISPPGIVSPSAAVKLRHGATKPQAVAVFETDPDDATKARCTGGAGTIVHPVTEPVPSLRDGAGDGRPRGMAEWRVRAVPPGAQVALAKP